jgi:hypothetical protein
VFLTSTAFILAELEEHAKNGGLFELADGKHEKLYPRLLAYPADKEEEQSLTAVSKGHCPRCTGFSFALALEKLRLPDVPEDKKKDAANKKKRRPQMLLDAGCGCMSAERRTPSSELAAQKWSALRVKMPGFKGAALGAIAKKGTRCDVSVTAHTLRNVIPHEVGGMNILLVFDCLHVIGTGMIPKFVACIVSLAVRESGNSVQKRLERAD